MRLTNVRIMTETLPEVGQEVGVVTIVNCNTGASWSEVDDRYIDKQGEGFGADNKSYQGRGRFTVTNINPHHRVCTAER